MSEGGSRLKERPETVAPLSTAKRPETVAPLSTALIEIDRRRRRQAVSVSELAAEARIKRAAWLHAMSGRSVMRPATLARLDRALARLGNRDRAVDDRCAIVLYRLLCGLFAPVAGAPLAVVQAMALDFTAERPFDVAWLSASKARRLAIYALAVEYGLGNATTGRAVGCSRQAVHKTASEIEDMRGREPAIDALLERLAALIKED